LAKAHVLVYSRPGCHLCDDAKATILNAGCSESFHLEEVSIADDLKLLALYQNDIPVVLINGVEAFRHRVEAAAFRKLIHSAI
jgi:hypothetical protein